MLRAKHRVQSFLLDSDLSETAYFVTRKVFIDCQAKSASFTILMLEFICSERQKLLYAQKLSRVCIPRVFPPPHGAAVAEEL